MLNLPNLPEKEELEFKEKEFFLSLYEQFQSSSKIWFYVLLGVAVLAIPAKILIQRGLTKSFIARYQPPAVNLAPYTPLGLKVIKAQIVQVAPGTVSAYAQILNPNLDISASGVAYEFQFKNVSGQVVASVPGQTFALAGESKYVLVPTLSLLPEPAGVDLVLKQVNWTKRRPDFDVQLDVLQKTSGVTPEGKFFVEALVRNLQGFQIKRVEVNVLVFDKSNQNVAGVNYTYLTNLMPLESRYFRAVWPTNKFSSLGQVQVIPSVNLLQPGLILGPAEKIPPR